MIKPISRKYIIIPVLYAAVLTVLFVLQFSGKSTITETIGDVEITAHINSGGNGGNIERVTIEHPAVSFDFSRKTTLRARTDLGRTVEAGVRDFSLSDTGAELLFDEGIVLEVIVSSPAEGLDLVPRLEDPSGIEALEIPYRLPEAASVETGSGLPAARISSSGGEYFAALPRRGSIEGSAFFLPVTAGNLGSIRIDPLGDPGRGLYASWFSRAGRLPREEEYLRQVEDYRDKAYLGWTDGRYRGTDGWLYPSGQVGFLEETLLAAISEAVRRLDFEAFDSLRDAAGENGDALSFRSSVYLGGLREANRAMVEEGWGPEGFREAVRSVPEEISVDTVSVVDGLELLGLYAESIRRIGDPPADLGGLRGIVEDVIYPAVVVTEEGLFIETEPGFSDSPISLEAGRILRTIGNHEGDDTLASVGRALITAQISASDELGFCPGGYTLEDEGAFPGTVPLITAETVFGAAFPELVFPQWTLLDGLDSDSFVFTGVPGEIETTGDTARMVFRFFPGRSHYLIVRGIDDLQGMELRDINWRSDPQFDIYSIGYFYEEDAGTLLIKLGHRAERIEEPVIIRY